MKRELTDGLNYENGKTEEATKRPLFSDKIEKESFLSWQQKEWFLLSERFFTFSTVIAVFLVEKMRAKEKTLKAFVLV